MTSEDVAALIGNPLALVPGRPFGAILGSAPSKGARSPLLWRAAFGALGIVADFHPMDVAEDRLSAVVKALKADSRFIGGAVTSPFKEDIIALLDAVTAEAAAIGAVNALYRTSDGGIAGANTDGIAARESLIRVVGDLTGKRILLLGLGGAGKAVATCLLTAGPCLTVYNRTGATARAFVEQVRGNGGKAEWVADVAEVSWEEIDVVVNCTSCGFSADGGPTTESPVDLAYVQRLKDGAAVFDIIYQPLQTALPAAAAERGLITLNGKAMNLGQAVIAFCLAFPDADADAVAEAMAFA